MGLCFQCLPNVAFLLLTVSSAFAECGVRVCDFLALFAEFDCGGLLSLLPGAPYTARPGFSQQGPSQTSAQSRRYDRYEKTWRRPKLAEVGRGPDPERSRLRAEIIARGLAALL